MNRLNELFYKYEAEIMVCALVITTIGILALVVTGR